MYFCTSITVYVSGRNSHLSGKLQLAAQSKNRLLVVASQRSKRLSMILGRLCAQQQIVELCEKGIEKT